MACQWFLKLIYFFEQILSPVLFRSSSLSARCAPYILSLFLSFSLCTMRPLHTLISSPSSSYLGAKPDARIDEEL